MHLSQSMLWKQASIAAPGTDQALVMTTYQHKEYIGRFLSGHGTTNKELRQVEQSIRSAINGYCPELVSKVISMVVFPQIFVS